MVVGELPFSRLGGIAVVANHQMFGAGGPPERHSRFAGNGMYFGCHDGSVCTVTQLVVEGNFIDGVTAPDPQDRIGMQVKLNSVATIRDNIVMNTKGPGIMVYGSHNMAEVSS